MAGAHTKPTLPIPLIALTPFYPCQLEGNIWDRTGTQLVTGKVGEKNYETKWVKKSTQKPTLAIVKR